MGSGADMNDFNASPMLDEEEVKAERSDSGSSDEAPEKNENKLVRHGALFTAICLLGPSLSVCTGSAPASA